MISRFGENGPPIAGYEGNVWTPFLPVDLAHPGSKFLRT